jgi:glycosyltransferase involved in cell wall biosynthesis
VQDSDGHNEPEEPRSETRLIVISANSSWNIVNFRGGLIRSLRNRGYEIAVAAPRDEYSSRLAELGASFIEVKMNSAGSSVAEDLRLLWDYLKLFRRLQPSAYLGFTVKPNIYGSLAARAVGAKVINNISGLGTAFIKQGFLTALVAQLYRFSFRKSSTIFFQNADDMKLFVDRGLVRQKQVDLLPGSGVDLERFKPGKAARAPGPFRFLLVGRLLWDKGVGEYVEAARLVRRTYPDVRFQLLGPIGSINRTAVPSSDVERWQTEGVIEYLGKSDDVRGAMEQADCIVLPSYREGLPRALLEGSAMGKPLIATDVPGCRDVIVDGETGYLCAVRSADSLAAAMVKMLETSPSERLEMGRRGRRKVEDEFCETRVVAKYLEALGDR